MRLEKETLDVETLEAFDYQNFGRNHRMTAEEWEQMLSTGRVAIYTLRDAAEELVSVLVLKTSSIDVSLWYFYSIAVAREHRKKGWATFLFNEVVKAEKVTGIINSHCHIDSVASIALHRSLGFKVIQYVNDFYGDSEDAILWKRVV